MLEDLVANLQNHAETGQIPKPYRYVRLHHSLLDKSFDEIRIEFFQSRYVHSHKKVSGQ